MKSSSCTTLIIAHLNTVASKLEKEDESAVLLCCCLCFKSRLYQCALHSSPLKARLYQSAEHCGPLKTRLYHSAKHCGPLKARLTTTAKSLFLLNFDYELLLRSLRSLRNNNHSYNNLLLVCFWSNVRHR